MSRSWLARVVAGLALATASSACVHQAASSGSAPGIAPQLSVERFLSAANCVASTACSNKAQDIETMGRLFGTSDGSVLRRDPRSDVEQRMYALASLLRSDDYKVVNQNIVPGRVNEAVVLTVRLHQGGRQVDLPFTMVRARGGDWLVENIDLKPMGQRQ